MKRLKRAAIFVALASCVAVAGGSAIAAPRAGSGEPPVSVGSRYLALGDSVTFGYMEPSVVPTPNYKNAANFIGYPEELGAALHLTVANAACPGETSASLINPAARSNGCENAPKPGILYRKSFPLHVHYSGSQLAYAVAYLRSHHDVRLVSLMIGANDFFVCQETTKDACGSNAEQKAVMTAVESNIRHILSAIRNKAHYRGQLVVLNYYSLDYASKGISAQSALVNRTQDAATKGFHVTIADGYGALRVAAARSKGGDTCAAGLLTQLRKGGCGIHPSYAGQALLAQAIERMLRLV